MYFHRSLLLIPTCMSHMKLYITSINWPLYVRKGYPKGGHDKLVLCRLTGRRDEAEVTKGFSSRNVEVNYAGPWALIWIIVFFLRCISRKPFCVPTWLAWRFENWVTIFFCYFLEFLSLFCYICEIFDIRYMISSWLEA